MAFKSITKAKGGSRKQFSTPSGGKAPFTATPAQATAAMQGREPPSGSAAKTMTKVKGGRKQFQKAGGKKVF